MLDAMDVSDAATEGSFQECHRLGPSYRARFRFALALGLLAGATIEPLPVRAQTPPNDDFRDAIPILAEETTLTGSNIKATKEPGEPDHAGNSGGKSVWWYWQAPARGYLRLSTARRGAAFLKRTPAISC